MNSLPALDILIYAHDGRGLGHVSRSLAIIAALREMYPQLRVLFVSGSTFTGELASLATDWIKLPAYKTKVVEGKSRGIAGESGFEDKELGLFRSEQLKSIVQLYRPKVILADHSPQGKHRELLPALETDAGKKAHCVLGIRGVVGEVKQTLSGVATETFAKHYKSLLWYGDSSVLGGEHLKNLHHVYGVEAVECGYVSRFICTQQQSASLAGVVSLPWLGEKSESYIKLLAGALSDIGNRYGKWHVFTPYQMHHYFDLDNCIVEEPSQRYSKALLESHMAIIYGGYNSLVDVLSLKRPALVCVRSMADKEQDIHLERLQNCVGGGIHVVQEECVSRKTLKKAIIHLQEQKRLDHMINLTGAQNTAKVLADIVSQSTL